MIVRLRKRLTLAAIAALILIFAVTVAAINLANAWSLRGQISQSLQMLMGSYIPPSEREKVFDRFYRAESAAQTQGSANFHMRADKGQLAPQKGQIDRQIYYTPPRYQSPIRAPIWFPWAKADADCAGTAPSIDIPWPPGARFCRYSCRKA